MRSIKAGLTGVKNRVKHRSVQALARVGVWLFVIGSLASGCDPEDATPRPALGPAPHCDGLCPPEAECTSAGCVCPGQMTACGPSCVDTAADPLHCGGCERACAGAESCEAGVCKCPGAQLSCAGACVNAESDARHCGGCDRECARGQICSTGTCVCPGAQEQCGDTCIDTQTSATHCGGCGNACPGGQVCQLGSCVCPEGQGFCGGSCIDISGDRSNCGGCEVVCAFGEGCSRGECESGALGTDGCEGLAQNLTISEVAAYQTVKIAIAKDGAGVAERNTEVIVGRPALLRAFASVGQGWVGRVLSARLHLDDGNGIETLYSTSTVPLGASSVEGARETTFEFMLPAELVTRQARYAVEVVECGAGEGPIASPRFPAAESAALGAVDPGGLRVHFVPLRSNGRLPDTSAATLDFYRTVLLATYPVSEVEVTLGEPLDIQPDPHDWLSTIDLLRALRASEAPDPGVYYYGLLHPFDTPEEFCSETCIAGVGYVPSSNFGADTTLRVATGVTFGPDAGAVTMLHELGHNHLRRHTPCVPEGSFIEDVDPDYPYAAESIGAYGYSLLSDTLIPPNEAQDLMGYCESPWFSDYTYDGLLDTVLAINGPQALVQVTPERVGSFRVLLLDPARGARWGVPIAGPAVASGVEETATVLDDIGAALESVSVYRTEIADLGAFAIQVPEPRPGWHAIQVAGAPPVTYTASP